MMHAALMGLAWAIAVAWVAKLMETAIGLRRVPDLRRPEFDATPEGEPGVVVIVPARNEAEDLGDCLESLMRQDYARMWVIAVDDRSEDGTGAIMDAAAKANGERLEAMHVETLPEGWLGKTHAMAIAARRAMAEGDAEYLLFTDGDVVFREDAVRRALAQAGASGADHFVLLPTTVALTRGEGMVLAFLQVMSLWAVRLWRVDDAKAMRDAIGVGAFNLIRAEAYEQVGGFEAMPMEVLEDLTLGRRVKRAGLRQGVAVAPGMVSLHWAAGVGGILRGMMKNIFAVFRFRGTRLILGVAGLVLGCIAPAVFLLIPGTRAAGAVALAAAAGMYALMERTTGVEAMYVVLSPIAAALVAGTMLWSMAATLARGGVSWRGTFYPLKELRRRAEEVRRG